MSIGDEIKLWNYLHKDEEKSAAEKQREEEALERIRGPRSNYFNGYDPMKAEKEDKPASNEQQVLPGWQDESMQTMCKSQITADKSQF